MSKILSGRFNNLTFEQTERLAVLCGALVQRLYELNHNLQADPTSGHRVFYVALEGAPGSGKSTIAQKIVIKNVGGDQSGYDGLVINFPPPENSETHENETKLAWETYWSGAQDQQNRLYDCFIVESPYHVIIKDLPSVSMLERFLPGIELLEHPDELAEELRGIMISVDKERDGSRSISVKVDAPNADVDMVWQDFVRQASAQIDL